MHEFTFLFKLEPAGDFGLPEQDTIVRKHAGENKIYSPSLDGLTFNTVTQGTLSQFREEPEALSVDANVSGVQMCLRDNFLWAVFQKEDYKAAEVVVFIAVDHFTDLLVISRGAYFRAAFLQATVGSGAERKVARLPQTVTLLRARGYDLPKLKQNITWAFNAVPLTSDKRLAKSLDYFNHAQFLNWMRSDLPSFSVSARVRSQIAADIFSNYYKAVSVIVGDSKKGDRDWQSRYKTIGLSYEYFKTKIERVRTLRNDYGVAHYDLDDKIEQLNQEIKMATTVAKEVIEHYISSLQSPTEPG